MHKTQQQQLFHHLSLKRTITDIQYTIMSKCTLWGKEVLVDIPPEVFPSQEERKARFDLFPNCEHGWFTSPCNGAQLHYLICRPPSNQTPPKGIVVFAHGVQGQSARGFVLQNGRKVAISYLAEQLIQAGYALFALDALGHGFSEGKRFYIERWQDNRKDLDQFAQMVAKQHESVPLFLMGESYGGCLTLHVAALWEDKEKAPKNYEGIVLMAPAVIGDLRKSGHQLLGSFCWDCDLKYCDCIPADHKLSSSIPSTGPVGLHPALLLGTHVSHLGSFLHAQ